MIDRRALLATLRPLVTALEDDIRTRAAAELAIDEHLREQHTLATDAHRTAMHFETWRDGEVTQAAVSWVLSACFVRFLEDNRLIDAPLIAGPGDRRDAALGQRQNYFAEHPAHSDREYLEHVFRTVAGFSAVAALFDERHVPLWQLGPSGDGARQLRETFARIDPDMGDLEHDFTDADLDTRFLGDLYQDLSETARERYTLYQTPEFVERFILARTLDPAIEEFGLAQVRLIDPTCGSGHFLIGAFERLFGLWQEREPGTTSTVLAERALGQIYGVDLNPYAAAIARFRLLIAALKVCGVSRLDEAPALRLNLATGDSLLHGAEPGRLFQSAAYREGIQHVFAAEDGPELQRILGQGYHAVVGNPPYKAVKDAALRDEYRKRYASCHGKYVMTVPFMERFFELARLDDDRSGFVGKITGNSFMKREFGKLLVEKFLPTVEVTTVIDASGAYIPGHGTPTVLIFGRSRSPVLGTLRVLDGISGEPGQPADPAQGLVWSSIEAFVDRPGEQNAFIRASDIARSALFVHQMILGAGRDLKFRLEDGARRLSLQVQSMGISVLTGEDAAYAIGGSVAGRSSLPVKQLVDGKSVRDWRASLGDAILGVPDVGEIDDRALRRLWPSQRTIESGVYFGKTKKDRGMHWARYTFAAPELGSRKAITWSNVATHNHFAIAGKECLFKETAPLIRLDSETSEDEVLWLLGVLNSSVACFWLKQVGQNKGSTVDGAGARQRTAPFEDFFQFNVTAVGALPLPRKQFSVLARSINRYAQARSDLLRSISAPSEAVRPLLLVKEEEDARLLGALVSLQEELDWQIMRAYGIVPESARELGLQAPPIAFGERAFEIVLARRATSGRFATTWFDRHQSMPTTEVPPHWPDEYRAVVERRIELIESDPDIGLLEQPEHKRRWAGPSWEKRQREALTTWVLDSLEDEDLWTDVRLRSAGDLTDALRSDSRLMEALDLLASPREKDPSATVARLVTDASAPHLAALRLNDNGMRKRAVWEHTWDLQRREDAGEVVGSIPVPPKYVSADMRAAAIWKLRGKLDVPKERFFSVPGAERGADASMVVGWAGWNEPDRARALAGRIQELRDEQAADAERLTPLLAGILELLPWIHQWHPDPDPLYGGPPGRFFDDWLDGELATLGVTRDDLTAWRPTPPRAVTGKLVRGTS